MRNSMGTQFVSKEGESRKQVPVDSVRTLIGMFKDIQFTTLKDEYEDRAMSDAPSAIVTYATKDRSKTVKHYWRMRTQQLKKLEQAIDRIAKVHEWWTARGHIFSIFLYQLCERI